MKKSTLYEIAIKILGLYLIVKVIEQAKITLTLIPIFFQQEQPIYNQGLLLLIMTFGLIVLILFTYLLLFRTQQVAHFITKPEDKEENIQYFAKKENIFEISLVLLGLILTTWTLPDLIIQLKIYITRIQKDLPIHQYNEYSLIPIAVKFFLGVIAIVYSKQFAKLLK